MIAGSAAKVVRETSCSMEPSTQCTRTAISRSGGGAPGAATRSSFAALGAPSVGSPARGAAFAAGAAAASSGAVAASAVARVSNARTSTAIAKSSSGLGRSRSPSGGAVPATSMASISESAWSASTDARRRRLASPWFARPCIAACASEV